MDSSVINLLFGALSALFAAMIVFFISRFLFGYKNGKEIEDDTYVKQIEIIEKYHPT